MKNSKNNIIPFNLFVFFSILFILAINIIARPGSFHRDVPIMNVIFNFVCLAIPLLMLFVVSLMKMKLNKTKISKKTNRFLYYIPRIGVIVHFLFLITIIFIIFQCSNFIWSLKSGFLIREFPLLVMAILMVPAWKWSSVGFFVFGFAGVYYAYGAFMAPIAMLQIFLTFSAPSFLVALLFFIHWQIQKN